MNKIFIPTNDLDHALKVILELKLDPNNTFIGNSFKNFAQNLNPGDTAIILSLTYFNSITELLYTTTELGKLNIKLNSIKEQWFNNPKLTTQELLQYLLQLGVKIHNTTPTKTTTNTTEKQKLRTVDRVNHAKQLHQTLQMPVDKACKIANCSIAKYYTYAKKL